MPVRPRITVRIAALAAALALVVNATGTVVAAPGGTHERVPIKRVGTAHLSNLKVNSGASSTEIQQELPVDQVNREVSGNRSYAHVPSANVPRPATSSVSTSPAGFPGLDHFNNRYPDGASGKYVGTQFSLVPPDQALCVGNGTIIESVNTVVRVRDTSGAQLTASIPLNEFFGLTPEIVRGSNPVFGDFTSDPKCYFDAPTGRFFLTILQADVSSTTGAFTGGTHVYLAVSKSSDPVADGWYTYVIDTTDSGTAGCPCLGDQPLIGADANGFYISTNEFPLFSNGFNGAVVYAMQKSALVGGTIGGSQVFHLPTLAEGYAYSIQPAVTPPGGAFQATAGGTEYFMSALDFNGKTDSRIAVWKMTNTSSLATTPNLTMSASIVQTVTYGQPPAVTQKAGSTPLIDYLKATKQSTEHLSLLNSNDDRMNQVSYADGHLWGAVNTVVKGATGPTRTGIAYFIVDPSPTAPVVVKDGYVAVAGDSVMFPAVAATASGAGVMSFTLAGPNTYPSAAYVTLDASAGAGAVTVVKTGAGPSDSFGGLGAFGGAGVDRWGDYGAAAVGAHGTIWFAVETVNQTCDLSTFANTAFTCGNSRSLLANWGTWIAGVTP